MDKFLQIAIQAAQKSKFPRFRHGAVLIKGGKVINTGFNKNVYCSFTSKFSKYPTRHAEIDCIFNVSKHKTQGAKLLVVRINPNNILRNSFPCFCCQTILSFVGIKKCFFSDEKGKINQIKIK